MCRYCYNMQFHTLGDAGILVKSKRYVEIAELINLIVGDPDIRVNWFTGRRIFRRLNMIL